MTGMFDHLPHTSFPLYLELISVATGATVWDHTVTSKGMVVPPPRVLDQEPVRARTTFADGLVAETDADEDGRPARTRVVRREAGR